jgi:hypothetical protein
MWNSGVPISHVLASAGCPMWMSLLTVWTSRLSCVSTAPLGRPVVPDVYMMTAGEPGSTASGSRSGDADRSACSYASPMMRQSRGTIGAKRASVTTSAAPLSASW